MPDHGSSLSAEAICEFFARGAEAVDAGAADPRDGLRYLAAHDMFGPERLRTSFELIRSIATVDLASAFSLWSHTMVLECLAASSTPQLASQAARLRTANAWGSTAMAPAIKYLAGLGELPVTYRRTGDDYILDGPIPWASNLFDENVVLVLAARSADNGDQPLIFAVDGRDPAVRIGRALPLLALSATASSTLELHGARLTTDGLVSSDLAGYMRSMKPRLLLLQTAYCLGLADASSAAAAAWAEPAAAVHRVEHAAVAETLGSLEKQARALVDGIDRSPSNVPMRDIVQLRLQAAQVAQAASGLELRLAGGAGFVAGTATARRYREAAFLPVQTPTEGQLLTELGSKLSP
jgi:alkylation response protein AidB-like acyl-CoA dehydrogenase